MNNNEAILLARKYHLAGNLERAEHFYRELLKTQPKSAGAYYELGNVLRDKDLPDEAIYCYQKSIECDPNFCGSYNSLGNILRKIEQEDKAIPYFEKAIEINPNFWGSYYNLGQVLQNRGQIDEAISLFQKALQINPNQVGCLNNLGNCFKDKGLIDEAITCYQKAIRIQPNHATSFFNLGVSLGEKSDFNNALFCYQTAIQFQPDYVEAHFNRALLLLLLGNYEEGLKGYEWRWRIKDPVPYQRNFSQPLWQRTDIKGLTILLHAEQGLGDVIQFVRYVPYVAHLGSKVLIECHEELKSLLKNVDGVQQVISQGEALPPFDVHCPIASLPLIFDTTLYNIPAKIPYIFGDPILVRKWENKLQNDNSKLRIGVVWAGNPKNKNDKNRSIPLSYFGVLEKLSDITFYSLQKGKASKESKNIPSGMKFVDLTEEIDDFSDTSALIEWLDLTISVDTSVAHLVGAMGKPIWTLLPYKPDWRWMLGREDSPWYPTMRLFRQSSPGDWESVIAKVENELLKLLDEK